MKVQKIMCLAMAALAVLGTICIFIPIGLPTGFEPKVQLNSNYKMNDKDLKVKDKLKKALERARKKLKNVDKLNERD